jgi:hypothetical protein
MVLTWIKENLSWLIPCFFSVLFSVFNIILLSMQRKSHKAETKRSNDLFLAQLNILQTQKHVLLLDHRLAMYNSILKSFRIALGENRVDDAMVTEFLHDTTFADYLFDGSISTFCFSISDIYRKIIRVRKQQVNNQAKSDREYYLQKIEEDNRLVDELMEKLEKLKTQFAPFFNFHDIEFQIEMVKTKKTEKNKSTNEEQVQ